MSRSKWRLRLWRWHRRIGVALALLILLVSVTGIFLNHVHELGFDRQPIQVRALLSLYGVERPSPVNFALGDNWISGNENQLYLNATPWQHCAGMLTGAVTIADNWLIACERELLLTTTSGELIERIGANFGLPLPVTALGYCDEQPCLLNQQQHFVIDTVQLNWQRITSDHFLQTLPTSLPAGLMEKLAPHLWSNDITWERVLLDLHSGRLFGLGPWLADILALLLIALAISGLVVWWSGKRKRKTNAV